MRAIAILLACFTLAVPASAHADDKKPAPPKPKKALQMDAVEVEGHRDVPVGIVLTRDDAAKRALDSSIDEHVRDAVESHH